MILENIQVLLGIIVIALLLYLLWRLFAGITRVIISFIVLLTIFGLAYIAYTTQSYTPYALYSAVIEQFPKSITDSFGMDKQSETSTGEINSIGETDNNNPHYQGLLELGSSNITEGATKYGATIVLGDLDSLNRATFAHIAVSDTQEPGSNGETRPGKINNDPAGWRNYKENGVWVMDRTHLVGYQFSGIQEDVRNLVTATAYVNRGTDGSGSDENNPNGMLYYEQQLDNWVYLHPNYYLDLYVKPIYDGDNLQPTYIYMQWVGIDENHQTIPIEIGGYSKETLNNAHYVLLENKRP